MERSPPNREIGFGFVFVSCVSCVRAGEAKLRASVRGNLSAVARPDSSQMMRSPPPGWPAVARGCPAGVPPVGAFLLCCWCPAGVPSDALV